MPYLPTVVLLAAGLLLLVMLLVRTFRVLRRLRHTVSMVNTVTQDRTGLLRARSAALRLAVAQRRGAPRTQYHRD
ncbi:bacteriophage holin [Amycolatopsis jiangsuensis]|uniref:C4-dicarboxylate transporter n=1 Tax=Amycolatopsis jiangsuensis TaxID=1181879 RepID=A0A840IPW9_9PSEU|nr:bacteriophage holin [Amycolatopsis jiangsuensis]MBB4683599.1 C4-dicarboxylate transporter [Amycolatopsis jiangsuensis]